MEVILKGITPDGTKIQIEDWSKDFPKLCHKNSTIGFYPMCKTSIQKEDKLYMPPYPERGKRFRASLEFDNETEAREAFVLLYDGNKNFLDYIGNYQDNVISREKFLVAIA